MDLKGDLKGKRVTVVGLARSGVGAANLLARLGARVAVTDRKGPGELEAFLNMLEPTVGLSLGNHPDELFTDTDLIVISPGVPADIPQMKRAAERGIKIIGELELAYQVINSRFTIHGSRFTKFLAITGTNGKSTTTTLLYEMVKNSGFNAILGGNIGNALTEEILKRVQGFKGSKVQGLLTPNSELRTPNFIVAEVSSFQLETIDEFHPKVAAILNITPDHLDRYSSMSDYIDAKCRIFLNQKSEDFLILNADDPATEEIIKRGNRQWAMGNRPDIFYFSRKKEVEGAFYKDGLIHFNIPEVKAYSLSPIAYCLEPSTFRIKGVHNIENAMAASLMAILSGCSPDAVASTLSNFPGLQHRLEFVRDLNGVKFINDSKGTNVGAVIKSLESFDEPLILIAGGRDKDSDFTLLIDLVRDKVKSLVLIGEAREKIRKAVGDAAPVFMEDDILSAVKRAWGLASHGDVVLLSPACASFDMFRDFEDRGRRFKKAVMEL